MKRLLLSCALFFILLIGQTGAEDTSTILTSDSFFENFTLIVANSSITEGGIIPSEYTCMGAGKNPEVTWKGIPNKTKSLALILDDSDAPAGVFTHWILYNLSPDEQKISENLIPESLAIGVKFGKNSGSKANYYPLCPPSGQLHHYTFTLYALDIADLGDDLNRSEIDSAIEHHVINTATITAIFGK